MLNKIRKNNECMIPRPGLFIITRVFVRRKREQMET